MTTYREINTSWPDPMPIPSPCEAKHGTRSLVRRAFALAREDGVKTGPVPKFKYVLTSGRRITWMRRGVWRVNPNERRGQGGWSEIVHSVSHWAQRRFWPNENPHGPRHVGLERDLAAHAIECLPRWAVACSGSEMRKKPKPDIKQVRAARIVARIKTWQTKERRAVKALRKLRRQARYYGLETNL